MFGDNEPGHARASLRSVSTLYNDVAKRRLVISFGRGEATDEPARDARPTENRKLRRYWRTAAVDICKRLFLSSFVTRLEKDGVRWELDDEFSSLLEKVLGSSKRTIKESPA